ncbi:IS110 family transposase [Persicobacter diffluens]|uniref:IS110 family transposase n=1 Tax=Persicobacter diffluens TaxID=981 RepID=A0AAN4W154_9BACT|nr:IS110 family transposase [Persicobacter diffluens]GJM62595.1 IS110 family transposase [Persicobacter diffluens]GJM63588.1 IS110 family transposase [Persicobacter diffluens]
MEIKYVAGVDIAKSDFKVSLVLGFSDREPKVLGSRKFKNTEKGFDELVSWAAKKCKLDLPLSFVMEATGNYHEKLAWYLNLNSHRVSVVLANRAKSYMKSIGHKTKNDKMDAKGLAFMGAFQHLKEWEPMSKGLYQLRERTRLLEDLLKVETSLKNRMEHAKHTMIIVEDAQQCLQEAIDAIETQISKCREQIKEVVQKDSELARKTEFLTSIKGIGPITAATIIAETNGFLLFENLRQLTSYAGYDVQENQSGQKEGRTSISKKGNSHIRRILHMAALNVVKHEKGAFKALQERIYKKTNIKMKGYVAVQSKLLRIMYTLWHNEQPYDNQYHRNCARTVEGDPSQLIVEQKVA